MENPPSAQLAARWQNIVNSSGDAGQMRGVLMVNKREFYVDTRQYSGEALKLFGAAVLAAAIQNDRGVLMKDAMEQIEKNLDLTSPGADINNPEMLGFWTRRYMIASGNPFGIPADIIPVIEAVTGIKSTT